MVNLVFMSPAHWRQKSDLYKLTMIIIIIIIIIIIVIIIDVCLSQPMRQTNPRQAPNRYFMVSGY